jgi:uncharacterized protein YjbJ (UPF0337 family)
MVNQQVLAGHWNELRGKLKEKWGKLTDDDLLSFNGNVDQLVGWLQQKTGETREAIEQFLGHVADEGVGFLGSARERAQETAGQVADEVRQGYEGVRQGYAEAGRMVQSRPGQSLAVAFGVGLLAGIGVTLLLRDRAHEANLARGRGNTEQFARSVLDALAGMLPESRTKNRS